MITPDPRPITASRAILKITNPELVPSAYEDNDGFPQVQIKADYTAVSGCERTGESFTNWMSFRNNGQPPHHSKKAGQLVAAALGPGVDYPDLEAMVGALEGRYIAAQIGTSEDGKHSRIKHDTIGPAAAPDDGGAVEGGDDSQESIDAPEDAEAEPVESEEVSEPKPPDEEDFDDLPF